MICAVNQLHTAGNNVSVTLMLGKRRQSLVVVIPSAKPCHPCHGASTLPQHLPPAPRGIPCRGAPSAHRPQTSAATSPIFGALTSLQRLMQTHITRCMNPTLRGTAHLKQFLRLLRPGAGRLLFRQPSQNRKPCAAGNIIISCLTPWQHNQMTNGPSDLRLTSDCLSAVQYIAYIKVRCCTTHGAIQ